MEEVDSNEVGSKEEADGKYHLKFNYNSRREKDTNDIVTHK